MEKINRELLKQLYLITHPSRQEHRMITFIINFIKNIKGIYIELDHYGNLFVTKNTTNPDTYVCIVAHTDEILHYNALKEILFKKDIVFAKSTKDSKQCGLGADNSNGIYIALHLLQVLSDIKVCFTVEEEIGGIGAEEASNNTEFFIDVRYLLQADRRGKSDMITTTNGIEIASKEFISDLKPIMEEYKYSQNIGTFTDVGILCEELYLCGLNISCGYYNEHRHTEYTNTKELENCLNFIKKIILTLNSTTYPLVINRSYKRYKHSDYYNYSSYYDWEDDYPQSKSMQLSKNNPCNSCQHFDCQNCDMPF